MHSASFVLFTAFVAVCSAEAPHRSPMDLALTPDDARLLTADQTSGGVSLVDVAAGKVVAELKIGGAPTAIVLTPDGKRAVVSDPKESRLSLLDVDAASLRPAGVIPLAGSPRGLALSPDAKTCYAALESADAVAVVDLVGRKLEATIPVARWPRYLALSPDGSRLAVGANGDGGVAVVDVKARKQLFLEDFAGINLGMMQASSDGVYVYFPWMSYRRNPITVSNIKRGWVLASRIARVRLEKKARREAIALDPEGKAVSDPFGIALSPDGRWIVATAPGTHELLVYRLAGLPFQDYGGPGDHIDEKLLHDFDRFARIPLGGRPTAVRFAKDSRRVFIADYLADAVHEVDVDQRSLVRTIPLGGPKEPSLARKGEAIFYDGTRSLDQWYSCHSCHYEGGGNAVVMDTKNDGSFFTFKTVPSLRNVARTGPWMWHGWQKDLSASIEKSITETMLGSAPQPPDVEAVQAFLESLSDHPADWEKSADRTEAEKRGREVFLGEKAGCSSCHSGRLLTDGRVHDVGTGKPDDRYQGFNTPSLVGVGRKVLLLHDGRAKDLQGLLTGPHRPDQVVGRGELTSGELTDLIAYLKTL